MAETLVYAAPTISQVVPSVAAVAGFVSSIRPGMQLTSAKNPTLQAIRRAAAHGSTTEDGLIVAEGLHLVEEALRSAWTIEQIFATPDARDRHRVLLDRVPCEVIEVSPRAFAGMASTESTQEVLALLRPRAWTWHDLTRGTALLAVLDGIQDPGNAGTIIRSAEAFGATGVILMKGCVRVSNGKLLRASAGSIFRLPFLESIAPLDLIASLHSANLNLYALAAAAHTRVTDADLRAPCAIVAGSEGSGVSHDVLARAELLQIPTTTVESLNAAIACSIALFSAHQQRANL